MALKRRGSAARGFVRRRELFARAGATALGFSAVQSASAKAGQFSKLSIFDVVGEPALSSPFQAGGPQGTGPDTTYGYKKSDGPVLAEGYAVRISRDRPPRRRRPSRVRSLPSYLAGGLTVAALARAACARRRT